MIYPERRRGNLKKIEEMDKRDAEPLQPDWKTLCMNKKVDMVEVVRCKDCKHYRINTVYPGTNMIMKYCAKTGIAEIKPDWFCADGERKGT